jgi:small subunit ribosomal protein S6
MAREAPIYDLTLLLDPAAEDERREKILADVEGLIDRHGGTLLGRHDWGVRQAAFEVRKRPEADYHLVQFYATNEALEALDHTLKITDGVLRFRVIKLRPGTPEPPDLRTAAAGATAGTEPDGE